MDEIENKIQLVKGEKIKRMTKFDIKIKLNQMIREKIELKEDKQNKTNCNQKNRTKLDTKNK
jgi:hypothetical protein